MSEFVDTNGMLFTVVLAAQGVMILVFVVAPLTGLVFTKAAQKKADVTLVVGGMLLTFNGLFAGITYYLQNEVSDDSINDQTAALAGLIVGIIAAVMVGMYLRNHLIYEPPTALDLEMEMLEDADDEEGTIFDQRRRERLKKREQRGRR